MTTVAPNVAPFLNQPAAAARSARALQSLMQMWEEAPADEDESETELMVMLSGMVGSHAMSLADE